MNDMLEIAGPAGIIEAMLDRAPDPDGRMAVLCHPHPLYGGSMHDGVLDAAASVLLEQGVSVVRFNFRGVGKSEGRHANGKGEADDLAAVVAWVLGTHDPKAIVLSGYSFGANVAWSAAHKLPLLERVILIAPPVGMMSFDAPPPDCEVHVVYGDADEYIDEADLSAWSGVTRHCVEGANHFFMGEWQALSAAMAASLR